jgi:hypothetical protein
MCLTRLLTHADADGMDLATGNALERRPDDHGLQPVFEMINIGSAAPFSGGLCAPTSMRVPMS